MRAPVPILAWTISVLLSSALPANASGKTEVISTVRLFWDSFNKGDAKTALASCAPEAIIIDDFEPNVWLGPNACTNWLQAIVAYNERNKITGGIVTLGKPWHIAIEGDHAYVVVPAKYVYKQNAKPVVESGSIWTLALQRVDTKWLITAWSWAQH